METTNHETRIDLLEPGPLVGGLYPARRFHFPGQRRAVLGEPHPVPRRRLPTHRIPRVAALHCGHVLECDCEPGEWRTDAGAWRAPGRGVFAARQTGAHRPQLEPKRA